MRTASTTRLRKANFEAAEMALLSLQRHDQNIVSIVKERFPSLYYL